MKKKLLILGLGLGIFCSSFGQQDQHFSMFTESPVFLNPATAGFSPEQLQLFSNFRLQWSAVSDNPHKSTSASADWKFRNEGGNFVGAGVNFYNDAAGSTNFQTNTVTVPINYALQIDESSFLSFGLQPGFYQRVVKNQNINWDSQWNGVAFDQSLNSNEVLLSQNANVSRFDIGAGIYLDGLVKENARIKIGISGQHLTRQRVNFTNEDTRLFRRLNVHGSAELKRENTNVTILPAFAAFIQGPNSELIFGSGFRFVLKGASRSTSYFDEVKLTLGSYFRVGDAFIVTAGLDLSKLSFGVSYDANASDLTTATRGIGAVETFLRYRIEFGTRSLSNIRVQ